MQDPVPVEDLAREIIKNRNVLEAYVLIKQVKICLNVDDIDFHPYIQVKIYTNMPESLHPYYFEVSHTIQTPAQGLPNGSSRSGAFSEEEAVIKAVSLIADSIREAVRLDHKPSNEWLKPNVNF